MAPPRPRRPRASLTLIAVLLLAVGCGSGADGIDDAGLDADGVAGDAVDGVAGDAADGEGHGPRTFAAGEGIPTSLTLLGSDEGGRQSGIFGGYRPEVTFVDLEPMTCTVGSRPGGGALEPGETDDVELSCADEVTVDPGSPTFVVEEGGRQVGSGEVLVDPAG